MGRLSHTPPTVFSPRKCLLFRGKNLSFSRFSIETAKLGLSGRVSRRRSCRYFEFDRACAEIAVARDCRRKPFHERSSCNRLSPALEAVNQGSAQGSRRGRTRFSYLNFAKILAKGFTFARHFCEAVSPRKTLFRKLLAKVTIFATDSPN